jgi:hypothetical protein
MQICSGSYPVTDPKYFDLLVDGTLARLKADAPFFKIRPYILRDFFQGRKHHPRPLVAHHIPYLTTPGITAGAIYVRFRINPDRDDKGDRT